MSNKKTLADLMNNDFFIDFEDTEAGRKKAERKRLAESLTRKPLKEAKLKEGFYKYDYDLSKDKISEEDLYKALVTDGELVSLNAGNTGEAVSFKDGGVYCDTTYEITEYDGKFSVTEFFNSDDGECKEGDYNFETDSFETLCAELQRIFPNALIECKMTEEVNREEHDLAFYVRESISHLVNDLGMDSSEEGFADRVVKDIEDNYDMDIPTDMKAYTNWCSEIMCEVSRQLNITEDFKEPDNAVVDCKVNKVIAHSEDEKPVDCLGEKKPLEKPLTEEARSVDEIKAEIAKLQQELADALAAEKKASYGGSLPTEVWIYDMYIDPADKGTWTSAELYHGKYDGYVYETADKAIRGGLAHLNELADEGELEGEPIDYTVEAINIPVSEVDEDTLTDSGLDHLIESLGGQTPEAKAWQDANCYKWNAYAVINGKRKSVACTYEPKEINPDTLIASVRRIAAHKLNLIMSECFFLKKPFAWDGNLEITRAEFGAEPEYITTIQIKRQGDRDLSQIPEL